MLAHMVGVSSKIDAALMILRVITHNGSVTLVDERRRDQKVGSGAITGTRNIVEDSNAQQGFDVYIVRLRLHRVPEENQNVNLALDNHCPELLVAAERTRLQFRNDIRRDSLMSSGECLLDQATGRARTDEFVMEQELPVPIHPLHQITLAMIVRNERYPFGRTHVLFLLRDCSKKNLPLSGDEREVELKGDKFLAIKIQTKFIRMGPERHRLHLFVHLVLDPGFDHIVGEHIAASEEIVVPFKRFDGFLKRSRC